MKLHRIFHDLMKKHYSKRLSFQKQARMWIGYMRYEFPRGMNEPMNEFVCV